MMTPLSSLIQRALVRFRNGDAVTQLIVINVGLFIATGLLKVILMLTGLPVSFIFDWVGLPSSFAQLALRPWTIISYMFIHEGFFHLLFNMFCLHWFGQLYTSVYSKRELIWSYLCGGIFAGLFYMGAYNLFPYFKEIGGGAHLVGASGSIMTLMVSVAFRIPNQEMQLLLLGRIKLKYLVCGLILIDLLSVTSSNAGGHFAHLGGALLGVLQFIANQNRISLFSPLIKSKEYLLDLFKRPEKESKRVKFHRPKSTGQSNKTQPRNVSTKEDKRLVDILERLKNSGYGALSKEDREYLFKANNK